MKSVSRFTQLFGKDLAGYRIIEVCVLCEPNAHSPRILVMCLKEGKRAGQVVFFPERLLDRIPIQPRFRGWNLHKGYALVNSRAKKVFWLSGWQITEKHTRRPAGLWVTSRLLTAWREQGIRHPFIDKLRCLDDMSGVEDGND